MEVPDPSRIVAGREDVVARQIHLVARKLQLGAGFLAGKERHPAIHVLVPSERDNSRPSLQGLLLKAFSFANICS